MKWLMAAIVLAGFVWLVFTIAGRHNGRRAEKPLHEVD